MTTFATIDDLRARGVTLTGNECDTAQIKLSAASALLILELEQAGINWQRRMTDDSYACVLKQVTCSMVERAMMSSLPGVKSRQQTAGPYSFMDTMANPTGDLYVTSTEKKALGISRGRIGCIPPVRHCRHERRR